MRKFLNAALVIAMIASMSTNVLAAGTDPSVQVQFLGGDVNGTGGSTSTANAALAGSVVFDTTSKVWENLTYKGGKQAYDKMIYNALGGDRTDLQMTWVETGESLLPEGVSVVSRLYRSFMNNLSNDGNGRISVKGYIYGTPIVVKPTPAPVTSTVPESSSVPDSSEPEESSGPSDEEKSAPEEQTNNKEPDAATVAAITPRLKQGMNYITSPREELKVANFLMEAQRQTTEEQIKARNTEVSQWNDTSVRKTGYTGIKDLYRKLFCTDKLVISSLVQEDENTVVANLTIPTFADWKSIPDEILAQFSSDEAKTGKDLDGIENLLISPLGNRAAFYNGDDTKFDQAMTFYTDFSKSGSLVDLYSKYPKLYTDGSLAVRMVKEGSTWNIDKSSLVVTASINGKMTKLSLLS